MVRRQFDRWCALMVATAAAGFAWGWSMAHAEGRLPPARCTALAPESGQVFSGPVMQVIDGRTLCVADGPTPDQWVRVRLADIDSGNPRGALMAAVFAKDVICTADRRDGEGVVGRCVFDGSALGQLVGTDEVRAQAADWR